MDTQLPKNQVRSKLTVTVFLWRNCFWFFCLAGIISLATIRSPPIYGKLDFFLLDGRPWWPGWKELVTDSRTKGKTPIYTDYVTGYILGGVFGETPLLLETVRNRMPILYIEDMEKNEFSENHFINTYLPKKDLEKKFKCVINLIGYTSSWVPEETGHWHRRIGETSEFYKFRIPHREVDIRLALKNSPLQHCSLYSKNSND